ncbi:DUF7002 family protein [Paenibacillus eucommiae]|uniref:DarT domain-containing protein n=1 Tax=Paenibacillus eucommiae TaxID=1355755 RepID=A0ABS4IQL3_9BACL|nr:hypothetical protein [Paenibacillus eucommiae]MBP1989803.1 hypothetical protein [Paenibacillus eucommiae]
MNTIVPLITKAKSRKSLFHFTRVRNLQVVADLDALLSSYQINPDSEGERRLKAVEVNYEGHSITINAHLRISDLVMDAATTLEQFRAFLNRHVFFWPTLKDCQKMISTYARREPHEKFAVLEFDASSLISEHYPAVKLSKYDSGSSPRFPTRCSYKKSLDMFVPLNRFKTLVNNTVPTKASEIREVLIEDKVVNVSKYLQAVYVDYYEDAPACWRIIVRPLEDLRKMNAITKDLEDHP